MLIVLGILGAVISFGVAEFLRKLSVDRMHPYQFQVVACVVSVSMLPVWLWMVGRNSLIGSYDRVGIVYGMMCVVMNMVGATLLGNMLKSSGSPSVITSLVGMYPVVTGLLYWGLLGEEYTFRKFVAVVVMLLGVALFSY